MLSVQHKSGRTWGIMINRFFLVDQKKKRKTQFYICITVVYINGKQFSSIFHSWENALWIQVKYDLLDVLHVWGPFLHFIFFSTIINHKEIYYFCKPNKKNMFSSMTKWWQMFVDFFFFFIIFLDNRTKSHKS